MSTEILDVKKTHQLKIFFYYYLQCFIFVLTPELYDINIV